MNTSLHYKTCPCASLKVLILSVMVCFPTKAAHSQDVLGELAAEVATGISATGFYYLSFQAASMSQKEDGRSEADLTEVKDQLLQYEAEGDSTLSKVAFKRKYPLLARYLRDLEKENPNFKGLMRHELLEIAHWRLLGKDKMNPNENE